jgi:hypothetical protein
MRDGKSERGECTLVTPATADRTPHTKVGNVTAYPISVCCPVCSCLFTFVRETFDLYTKWSSTIHARRHRPTAVASSGPWTPWLAPRAASRVHAHARDSTLAGKHLITAVLCRAFAARWSTLLRLESVSPDVSSRSYLFRRAPLIKPDPQQIGREKLDPPRRSRVVVRALPTRHACSAAPAPACAFQI